MSRLWSTAVALVLLVGCDNPIGPDTILFDVTDDTYSPGEFVEYRLSNQSDSEYVYNFCFAVLERVEDDRWVVAGSAGLCAAYGLGLPAGETVTGGETLPAELVLGIYRFTMSLSGKNAQLHTRSFRVEVGTAE